jgi:hypothetical protein
MVSFLEDLNRRGLQKLQNDGEIIEKRYEIRHIRNISVHGEDGVAI